MIDVFFGVLLALIALKALKWLVIEVLALWNYERSAFDVFKPKS